jgi:tetratricopeptide (TPR) repeat protein
LALGTLDKRERSATASLNLDWQRKKEKSKTGRPGKVGYNMKILKKNWILILATLAAVALVLFNLPGLKAWRLRALAAEQIKSYVDLLESSSPDSTEGFFYCLLPLFHEVSQPPTALNHATQWLEQSQRLDPKNSHGNFLLGQAYCLKQEFKQAVAAFDGFLARRPDNLLAKAESGFAEISLARSTTDPQIAQTYRSKSLQSLLEAGYSKDSFTNLGDISFKQEKYQDTLVWYGISDSLSGLQGPTLIRYALLQLIFQGSSPYADQIKEGMVLELSRGLTVEPTSFFELSTGSAFQTAVYDGKAVVTLASNRQHAGILLKVMEANRFCFSILALDKPPQPTQIGVEVDFETFATTELVNGDGEWEQFDFEVDLDQGFHILTVKLINDLYIMGEIDRNAYIGPVTIKACQED